MKRFFEIVRSIDSGNIHTVVLTTGPNGVLVGDTEVLGGTPASVLKPRTGEYNEIHTIAAAMLDASPTPTPAAPSQTDTPEPEAEPTPDLSKIVIEIRNGTNITGLAAKTRSELEAEGYSISAVGNAAERNHEKTIVYALDIDQADTVKTLAEKLDAEADSGLPDSEAESAADILIILGANTGEST